MKNNKPQIHTRREDSKQQTPSKHEKYGYIYLVKSPASNELTVCAFHRKLKKDERVVYPSRFGLDYGIIAGSAMEIGQYQPGSVECHGARLHGDCVNKAEDEENDLLASSDELGIDIPKENLPLHNSEEAEDVEFEKDMVEITGEIDWIDHIVTEEDTRKHDELSMQEDDALRLCREKIAAHGLDMKLVNAHYLFGEPKIIFFFTSANRVDFRELVRDLVSIFRIRIELRQIGVRDESRVLGGLA
ncbi:MAG: regulatory iron-sulfur-containing complex subunit RicT, partial [Sphaerochaetaceae bacterium]